MSTGVVAAGAAAVAAYMYFRRSQSVVQREQEELALPVETHTNVNVERPPTTWTEALYFFSEAIRYFYNETLGRWHTLDLFLGLAYLSQRDAPEYPAADIVRVGRDLLSPSDGQDASVLLQQLVELRRVLLYCQGLKRRPHLQLRHWQDTMGIDAADVLKQQPTSGLLRPAFVIVRDREVRAITLCVRGTHSMKDLFTSLTGASKPHHQVESTGVVLGYSHLGMLASARYLLKQVTPDLQQALRDNPGYKLLVVGHSMGGGTAAMLTMMMRDSVPEFANAHCYAVACPACMTLELAESCKPYVTSLINGTDVVPSFCAASVDALREQVMRSAWFAEFQQDARGRLQRVWLESLRGVGSATLWTTRTLLSPATQPFRACYGPRLKGEQQVAPAPSTSPRPDAQASPQQQQQDAASPQQDTGPALGAFAAYTESISAASNDALMSSLNAELEAEPSGTASGLAAALAVASSAGADSMDVSGPEAAGERGFAVLRHSASGNSFITASGTRVTAVAMDTSPPGGSQNPPAGAQGADGLPARPMGGVGELRRRLWPFRMTSEDGPSASAAPARPNMAAAAAAPSAGDAAAAPMEGGSGRGMPDEKAANWRQQVGSMGMHATRVVRRSMASTSQAVAQRASDLFFQSLFATCRAPRPGSLEPLLSAEDRRPSQHAQQAEDVAPGVAAMDTPPHAERMSTSSSEDEEDVDADVDFGAAAEQRQHSLGLGVSAVVAAVSTNAASPLVVEEQTTAEQVLEEVGAAEAGEPGAPPTDTDSAAAAAASASDAAPSSPSSPHAAGRHRPGVIDPLHTHWKRKLYPAGRILHIVPAYALQQQAATQDPVEQPAATQQHTPAPATSTPSAALQSSAARQASGEDSAGAPTAPVAGMQAAASAQDSAPESMPSAAAVAGAAAAVAGAAATATTAAAAAAATMVAGEAAAAAALPEQYALLDVPSNEVYCRVKLCKSMVLDHYIPPTLLALDSVIAQLRARMDGRESMQE